MILRCLLLVLPLTILGCKDKKPPEILETESPELVQPEAPKPVETPAPEHVKKLVENFQRVSFDTDSSTLSDDARSALNDNADIMRNHADVVVEIQGHADERGTTDHNLALGQRRADAVRSFLTDAGIDASRIQTKSFGEERPLSSASGEQAWSQNRRAEFRVTWSDGGVQGTTR